jgi:hypothetical protein
MMSVHLSELQFPLLREFVDRGLDFHMPIDEAQAFDQRPFRSMLIRRWVVYSARQRGFHLTKEGRVAWQQFHDRSILRQDPTRPLTAYFDATAYGLSGAAPKKKRRKPAARVQLVAAPIEARA